jgi:hypothetical protein
MIASFMIARCAALILVAVSLHAAVIRGIVVENTSGYALSRSLVTLHMIGMPSDAAVSVRTSESGAFEFPNLIPGAYIVRASRRGFLPMEYGQRQWNSAGTPVIVDKDASASLNIRLSRLGAITGIVRDENEVGIPEQDVAAYTNTEPPRYVTRGRSDDRGVYRISGLDPGSYLVRTTGNEDMELSYLPTFGRQTLRVAEARPVQVYLDDEARDADVRPIRGTLFTLAGVAAPLPDQNFTVTVTLASDLGRRTYDGPLFRFSSLAPGAYEIYVEARENPPGTRFYGGYTEFRLDRNTPSLNVLMSQIRETQIGFQGVAGRILARRKDLAGVGPTQELPLSVLSRALLGPGRWELAAIPPPGNYVAGFFPATRGARPEGWNEIQVGRYSSQVTISLSGGASAMHGVVKQSGSPASWAPVFLETWDPIERKRLVDLRETRADIRGNYRFEGLPPGSYRVLSTFEYLAPDSNAMDLGGALGIEVAAHTDLQTDLDLYGIH